METFPCKSCGFKVCANFAGDIKYYTVQASIYANVFLLCLFEAVMWVSMK